MGLASKHYYLFGLRVWSVVVETHAEDVEEDEEEVEVGLDRGLDSSTTLSAGDTPVFGFTPWTPHYLESEDE